MMGLLVNASLNEGEGFVLTGRKWYYRMPQGKSQAADATKEVTDTAEEVTVATKESQMLQRGV